ncbi:pyridine nucleotide-disulfide oxidoreductase [Bordetella genomosp. 10]|uniref:Pyridine nucleotide-disulfide oxidoreductase n=1 Tax=Bordetella genomosp. 10 TaxID=1416804 RepID=A0A261S1W8_9BORD|nr:FAD-dependent oxidoreductase [Bordetella genomosp. 10]OZI31141.1 pyridine nucleotide-disulfide oxidoreductase [Bordetella genomosp. 10]
MKYKQADFLLVGGGLASATAAETLRREGAEGSILILSAESVLPYHRPALSKRYLLGTVDASQILVHAEMFYQEQRIEVALSTRAVSVDPERHLVETSTGDHIQYGKLLIATGASPRPVEVPGAALQGIYALRSKDDCDAIRRGAAKAKRVAVVGGSFLGMEVALSLREMGLSVTVVEGDSRLMRHLESPMLSDYFRDFAGENGVETVVGDAVVEFIGRGKVKEVATRAGKRIPCDLAVVCTGVQAATQFLEGSGIELEDGRVVVDDLLRANQPDVYAAGDVVSFMDPVFARRRHIEHWDNAVKQGRLAAMNMLGRRRRYDEVSYFFCEIGSIGFDMLGDPEGADETIERGGLNSRAFSLFYLKDDVPRALFSFGRPADEIRLSEGLIRYRTNLRADKLKLQDPDFKLDFLPMQNVLILQGGGALGAFECGVVKGLEEHRIFPDIVAGISIGALNGAIIAGNPKHATEALESFWSELQVVSAPMPEPLRQAATAMQILQFGVPQFFRPRWIPSCDTPWVAPWKWTSFYDTAPMRTLLEKYVDFKSLPASPVRLLVGAVNVLTSEFEVFDSYVDDMTPDHILASGSLPPGFSWTYVNGQPYWDGGIVSNSPLDMVVDRCGPDGKRVFIVDLFSGQKALPENLTEIMARRDEILYSERIRNDLRTRELIDSYRGMIESLLREIEPARQEKIRQRPRYIQLMGDGAPMHITRFLRKGPENEPSSRDYDFSDVAVRAHQAQGYALVREVLGAPGEAPAHLQPRKPRRQSAEEADTAVDTSTT